jgi:hypothetical protein
MIWKKREMTTIGDLMWGMANCDTKEEAQEFMKLYRAENEYADQNIGYLTGYNSPSEMVRLQKFFEVKHPIFSNNEVTYREAFLKGTESSRKG